MIIVSQDKKSIYNFDNIKSIDIVENEIYITDDILMDEGARIGEYATEERAKEVLQEIVNYASVSKINNSYQVADLRLKLAKMCRYEMPQE